MNITEQIYAFLHWMAKFAPELHTDLNQDKFGS